MKWYVKIWYVENMLGIYYVTVMIYDEIIMSESMKRYDMIYVRHEWYDMIDMQNDELAWSTTPTYAWKINDMINVTRNDIKNDMIWRRC